MAEVVKYLLIALPSVSLPIALLLVLLFFPEKIEKWSALLWKWLAGAGGIFRMAHKRYVKHDLQGRVNDFVRRLRRQIPLLENAKLRVEWVDPNTPRKSFMEGNQVVVRLRRDDPRDQNFVHGSYFFVSEMLLKKAKRYVSPSQREALDLFVCTKILEAEKPAVVSFFLDEYLHPKTDEPKSRVALYVDDFGVIDRAGFFFPILVQELEFLGDKVFGRRRDAQIIGEVDGLVAFLIPIATRTVGDQGDLNFEGEYCRFGLVIVGKPSKLLVSIEPYVTYIQKALVAKGVETIYMLSRLENKARVESIFRKFDDYACVRRVRFKALLRFSNRKEAVLQYLVVLRKLGVGVIQPSR